MPDSGWLKYVSQKTGVFAFFSTKDSPPLPPSLWYSPGMQGDRRQHTGFSIIELIVVIGVVMVLIGILLPVLGGARQTAQTSAQASQLRQLMLAVSMYADAWDDVYPIADERPDTAPGYVDPDTVQFGREWWLAMVDAGIFTREEAIDENTYDILNAVCSTTLRTDPRIMTPTTIVPWEIRKSSPVHQYQAIYPSDKGTLSFIQVGAEGTFSPWCCLPGSSPGPVAFVDGSVSVLRWSDFPEPDPPPILDIGRLIDTTWDGIRGRDR